MLDAYAEDFLPELVDGKHTGMVNERSVARIFKLYMMTDGADREKLAMLLNGVATNIGRMNYTDFILVSQGLVAKSFPQADVYQSIAR